MKLKSAKFCILNEYLYWKDLGGVLLNCLLENEGQKTIEEFHKGDCGGHHSWKVKTNKILRFFFYWTLLFSNVYKEITKCHQCHIFYGKSKLVPLPSNPISIEAPFQQWGLEFIGEINPNYSGQHRWILIATDYFTKWIEAIPTRRATDAVIMCFLEENNLDRFGFPRRIVIDNAIAFKSKKMINFVHKYHIFLNHSTTYYPEGNELAKYSNKIMLRIIKKLLEDNKRA